MKLDLNEKTSIPLFAVIGLLGFCISVCGGAFIFFASMTSDIAIAKAKNAEQDDRLNRQLEGQKEIRTLLTEIRERVIRIEAVTTEKQK